MRMRYLIVATVAALGAAVVAVPARAEPGQVLVPANHGFGWNAYPPSILMSPSQRTCRQVSKPSPGWMCSFEKPAFIEKPYDDERQAVRTKPTKKGKKSVKAAKRAAKAG